MNMVKTLMTTTMVTWKPMNTLMTMRTTKNKKSTNNCDTLPLAEGSGAVAAGEGLRIQISNSLILFLN